MATTVESLDRPYPSAIRPTISNLQQAARGPASPHTPVRGISSSFSSPLASYRTEEEALVFEFGARHLRAGVAGESAPRGSLAFGPEQSRRVGDYRQWLPGYEAQVRTKATIARWGEEHELWRMDLREVDLGLVEDKLERALREAYSRYLLLDSKTRRLVLVLPSVIPQALISVLLTCLFTNFLIPSVTLLSAPILSIVAAGLRSGLVVDIGWQETIITAIYEYREVQQRRTTRAMKLLTLHMAQILQKISRQTQTKALTGRNDNTASDNDILVDFQHVEEVTARLVWCQTSPQNLEHSRKSLGKQVSTLQLPKEDYNERDKLLRNNLNETPISIPLLSSSSKPSPVPFTTFSKPVESALFAHDTSLHDLDDHEQPLPHLLYQALLALSPDVRGLCMSRIVFTGGGSHIPSLKARLLDELASTVAQRGWDPVWGKAADKYRQTREEVGRSRNVASAESEVSIKTTEHTGDAPDGRQNPPSTAAAAFEPQVSDPIEDRLRREGAKGSPDTVAGVVRGVETLGAWAGASLVAGIKLRGIVEVERDVFLQHGLAGAKRDMDVSVAHSSRQSLGAGYMRGGGVEKGGWTLGTWA
ncbi:hypothetical protein MMC34_004934 [Xylographa carneopallida]|nr:hypothetical protein [Xylographa carneopallida]